jgi:enoyl-CoA hydratase
MDTVLFSQDDAIALITLNRPEKLNAIDPSMLDRLEQIVDEIDQSEVIRVLILTGAGNRAFSVGADINAWSALDPLDMWRRWVRDGHRTLQRFASLRQPTIAAINGFALGGGLELALSADLRIASADARFGAPEVKIGTLPGWGGTERLSATIGPARAKHLVLTGEQVTARVALDWGLVTTVVEPDELVAKAGSLAEAIAANAPVSVQLAKQVLNAFSADSIATALESIAGALAASTSDGREGISAFMEKRDPRYSGH